MGRVVRRVPADWEHPKRKDGSYEPLYDADYKTEADEWVQNAILWSKGEHPSQNDDWAREHGVSERNPYYWDWEGPPPREEDYRPAWPEETRTHIQMYEDTSEGTPISPVMKTPEELARWLADNNASAFGNMTATYDQWLATIKAGWAPSAICTVTDKGGVMESGVAAMGKS